MMNQSQKHLKIGNLVWLFDWDVGKFKAVVARSCIRRTRQVDKWDRATQTSIPQYAKVTSHLLVPLPGQGKLRETYRCHVHLKDISGWPKQAPGVRKHAAEIAVIMKLWGQ